MMLSNRPHDKKVLNPIILFGFMNEDYRDKVVRDVLNTRGKSSPEARKAFEFAVNNTLTPQDIPQFPRHPARAAPGMLLEPVRHAVCKSDALACAALRIWAESHQPLRDIVSAHLEEIGIAPEYPDFSKNTLRGHLPSDVWQRETDALLELHDDLNEDDVALMLCYVSGKLPYSEKDEPDDEGAPADNRALNAAIEYLAALPPTSPEWDRAIPAFAKRVNEIVESKQEERTRAANLDSAFADIRSEFSDELAYLESDISTWSADKLSSPEDIFSVLSLCEKLPPALTDLRAVRNAPPAATRRDEAERRKKNDQLEDRAAELLDEISALMSGKPLPNDPHDKSTSPPKPSPGHDATPTAPPELPRDDTAPAANQLERFPDFDAESLRYENISLQEKIDQLTAENDKLQSECESLRTTNHTLNQNIQFLQSDKQDLSHRIEELESELDDKQTELDSWRHSYEEESQKPRLTIVDVPRQVESVADAVTYASEMFPDRLLLKTNSKSQIRGNPFQKPEAVWKALEWLATSYYDAKAGISSVPDFDLSVRDACGWQYKSDQHETTRNRYREWYTVKANNKTYWLLEHIGTGSSKDARHTIRIGFDWDKDKQVVVVGFIGQHQRTKAT